MIRKTGYEWCKEDNIRILDLEESYPKDRYPTSEDCFMQEPTDRENFLKLLTKCRVKPNSAPRKPYKYLQFAMYGLVPYNISTIQKGIQYGHALQEYNNESTEEVDFAKWKYKDKTFIILDGGTTNTNGLRIGTLNKHLLTLKDAGITTAEFYEPDLGDQLTAVVFLVDERVFNYKTDYPDYVNSPYPWGNNHKPTVDEYAKWEQDNAANRLKWVEKIGGPKNDFLRTFLRPFRLAT